MQDAQSCRHSSPSTAGSVFRKSVSAEGAASLSSSGLGLSLGLSCGVAEGVGVKNERPRWRMDCIVSEWIGNVRKKKKEEEEEG